MELKAKDLDYSVPLEKIQKFRKTKLDESVIGQPRALKALQFGVGINAKGYNIFVIGDSGTGKHSTVRKVLTHYKNRRPLKDVACVCNFADPDSPVILYFPKGRGIEFKEAVKAFITLARKKLRIQTETKIFKSEKAEIFKHHEDEENKLRENFEVKLNKDHFTIVSPKEGEEGGPEICPVIGEEVISINGLYDMVIQGKLTKKDYESLRTRYFRHKDQFDDVIRKIDMNLTAAEEKIDELEKKYAAPFIASCIEKIRQEFKWKEVNDYLDAMKEDILNHLYLFLIENPEEKIREGIESELTRYEVNLLVDNSKIKNCPVIYETHPSFTNLFGTIEYKTEPGGEGKSTFMQIKSGSLIKASGGFVVINADDLPDDYSWDYLKRTLKSGEIQIQPQGNALNTMGTSIKPQPIKIDVKVILIGDWETYFKLSHTDVDFSKYFNVTAVFDNEMDFTDENIRQFVCLVAEFGRKMHYKPITDEGISYLIKFGRKLTADRRKLSVRFSKITDLISEANYWAKEMGLKDITVETLKKAEEEKRYLMSFMEDDDFDKLTSGKIIIQVDGKRVGAINALGVIQFPYPYGIPDLLTAVCTAGDEGIINIEHEADLSGPVLDKAILITEGFLRSRYEDNYLMSFRASLCFEQSYQPNDGDSASAAQILAILSAVTGVSLRQDLAVTGSVNQHGEIQPIGGVSEKITGFYKLCKKLGFTGKQGVVVPKQNINNILLSQEIIDAVAKKQFHIYPISTIDEGIKLFTGMDSDTFNALAKKKFKTLSAKAKNNK